MELQRVAPTVSPMTYVGQVPLSPPDRIEQNSLEPEEGVGLGLMVHQWPRLSRPREGYR